MEDAAVLRSLYRTMLLIRRFEERILELLLEGKLASTMCHVSIGQEAVAAGVCSAMGPSDYVTSTHRGHGHLIARGGDVKRMMAELLGRATGYSKGRGGSMHMADIAIGHLGANGIVGGHLGIATGAGLWSHLTGDGRVTVAFFGDGAVTEGIFHEALNMAALWKLPVVYVCENNQFAMSLPWERATAQSSFAERARAYGMPGVDVDGQDALAVRRAALAAIERARRGEGPTLIGALTYRFLGHSRADPSEYRDKNVEAAWRARDPLRLFQERTLAEGALSADAFEALEAEVRQEIDEAVRFAEESLLAPLESAFQDVYA
ncbi:MAG TPA: thiamine pyrophosphate-dependent dehydrogenase E1 component subunit alpha [Chloroflexota bacterium]